MISQAWQRASILAPLRICWRPGRRLTFPFGGSFIEKRRRGLLDRSISPSGCQPGRRSPGHPGAVMSIKARAAVEMLMPRLRRFGAILSGSQVDGDWLARRARAQALGPGRPPQDSGRLEVWLFQKMRTL